MDLPKAHLKEYVTKRTRKFQPTWMDVNELKQAAENMLVEALETGNDSFEKLNETMERIRYDVEKIGVMVSFVHPIYPELIAIGYSLCNTSLHAGDRFDKVPYEKYLIYEKKPGMGLNIAANRAITWTSPDLNIKRKCRVPDSIKEQFKNFIERSQRYYKDKTMAPWVRLI